jgi:hypothetical protein
LDEDDELERATRADDVASPGATRAAAHPSGATATTGRP